MNEWMNNGSANPAHPHESNILIKSKKIVEQSNKEKSKQHSQPHIQK